MAVSLSAVSAQQLIDRIVARVDGNALTLSDLRAAVGLGIVTTPPGGTPEAEPSVMSQLIDRQLLLAEVQRFPPPEPPAAAVDAEVTGLKARAGAGLAALTQSTGLDDERIHAMARDTLRIQAYLDQRFGSSVQVRDEDVQEYYRAHPEDFTRGGRLLSFDEAEALARQRASTARRQATIDQWMRDLRMRANVVLAAAAP